MLGINHSQTLPELGLADDFQRAPIDRFSNGILQRFVSATPPSGTSASPSTSSVAEASGRSMTVPPWLRTIYCASHLTCPPVCQPAPALARELFAGRLLCGGRHRYASTVERFRSAQDFSTRTDRSSRLARLCSLANARHSVNQRRGPRKLPASPRSNSARASEKNKGASTMRSMPPGAGWHCELIRSRRIAATRDGHYPSLRQPVRSGLRATSSELRRHWSVRACSFAHGWAWPESARRDTSEPVPVPTLEPARREQSRRSSSNRSTAHAGTARFQRHPHDDGPRHLPRVDHRHAPFRRRAGARTVCCAATILHTWTGICSTRSSVTMRMVVTGIRRTTSSSTILQTCTGVCCCTRSTTCRYVVTGTRRTCSSCTIRQTCTGTLRQRPLRRPCGRPAPRHPAAATRWTIVVCGICCATTFGCQARRRLPPALDPVPVSKPAPRADRPKHRSPDRPRGTGTQRNLLWTLPGVTICCSTNWP